jgi:subtilisin family serine protease
MPRCIKCLAARSVIDPSPALESQAMKLPASLACAALCAALFASPVGAASGSGGGGGSGGDPDLPGEVLVKLRSSNGLQPLLANYPVTLVSRFGARPIYRLKTVGAARVKDVLAALALDPSVMIAEANATHRSPEARKNIAWAIGTPEAYAAQWAPLSLRLREAQGISTGAGVRVAVLDTGVDRAHPALAGRLLPGFDFVDFDSDPSEGGTRADAAWGHGTHVAGLVAMVAPGAQILPVRVLDASGNGNAWVLAEALLYAVDPDGDPTTDDGAQVINLSLGSLSRTRLMGAIAQLASCAPAIADDPVADRSDPGYADDETRCANSAGAVVVAAAGNDSSDKVKEYPAAEGAYGLLAVTASNASGRLAGFANFGSWIDLAAPGDSVTSTMAGGTFATWSGTSMAAPLAAGTAALLRAAEPALSATDVVKRIKRTAALLCGTALRQVDAAAALTNPSTPATICR